MSFTLEPPPKNPALAHFLKQGLSSEPVGHWTQGLSRVANALLAGMEATDERNMESRQNSQLAGLLMPQGAPPQGGSDATTPAPPAAPPPMRQAPSVAPQVQGMPPQNVTGPVPPNVSTMTIPPSQVAQANPGTAPPSASAPPPNMPAPQVPGVPRQPQMPGQPPATSSAAPPQMSARVQQLLNSPDRADQALGRRMAQQILATQMTPKWERLDEATLYDQGTGRTMPVGGDRRPITDPAERERFGIPQDDKRPYQLGPNNRLINPPAETRVNMNTVADPILSGVGTQIVEARKTAREIPQQIQSIHEARRSLDQGATTGAVADWRLSAQKLFGLAPDQVANTEVFRASVGDQVLSSIKALGANPSNTDRDYIEKVKGGNITLDEASLRRILDIQEKYARQTLRRFNSESRTIMDSNPDAYRSIQGVMQFEEPQEYAPPTRQGSSNPATPRIERWERGPDGKLRKSN